MRESFTGGQGSEGFAAGLRVDQVDDVTQIHALISHQGLQLIFELDLFLELERVAALHLFELLQLSCQLGFQLAITVQLGNAMISM